MLAFNVLIEEDGSGHRGMALDFPEVVVKGKGEKDALEKLERAVYDQMVHRIATRQLIPFPSRVAKRQAVITFSVLIAAKVCLSNAMIQRGIQKTELARQMRFHLPQIARLLDLEHATRIQTVESALSKLGKRLTVGLTKCRASADLA